jgi:peptidoglycan DL-endopeptidase CwlO
VHSVKAIRPMLALLVAAALALVAPATAHADPGTDGTQTTIQDQLGAIIKAYQDAQAKLAAAQAKQAQFKAELAQSTTRLKELTSQIGVLASAVYRAGPATTLATMFDATSTDDVLQRADGLRTLSRTEDRQLREYTAVLASADEQQAGLDREVKTAQAQADEMAKQKAALQKTLDQLGNGPTAGVPVPAATAEPVPRNPDGSLPAQRCSVADPTTTGCLTPRTLHALEQARKAGFTHYTACFRYEASGEHPLGRACDFAADPGGFGGVATGASRDYGNRLAGWFIANAQRLGVMYVIWWHAIWNPVIGWHYYRGDGTANGNHMNHVHLSEL